MKQYFSKEKTPVYIETLITFLLFIFVEDLGAINSFAKLVVAILEFIIILELIRILIDFIFSDDHRIRLRLMIDSTIVFFIRDIMLIVNEKFDIVKIASMLGIIAVLFLFRYISMKYTPSHMEDIYKKFQELKK